jgi:hypothetical protein
MLRLIGFVVGVVLLWFAGLWFYTQRGKRRRAEEETPTFAPAPSRPNVADLTLQERDARDRRIAAATAKRWRKKGLL